MCAESPDRETVPVCDLCGSDRTRRVFEERGFPIVRCRRCGLVYVTPRLTQAKIAEVFDAFAKGQRDKISAELGLGPLWDRESPREKKRYDECLGFLLGRLPPGSRKLLDVGAGNGNLVIRAKQMGFDPFAFDVMSGHIERLSREHGIPGASAPSLHHAALPEGSFDAATLWDVLEHLPAPSSVLAEIRRILKPGGILALKTPNYNWLILKANLITRTLGKDAHKRTQLLSNFGVFAPEVHLYNFTPRTLALMLEKTGFSLIKISLARSTEPVSRISLLAHDAVTYAARVLYRLSLEKVNLNPSLTAYAEKR
jgi:2-polyprenyl-3-methyl-5-hydroxy-6-metoxy-1,4-benzoquinol methylase